MEEMEVEPVDVKLRILQIELASKCKRNEQQHDAKNGAELQTKWTKTTWKTFQETIRQNRNRFIIV